MVHVGSHSETVVFDAHVAPEKHQVGAAADGLQRRQHILGGHEDVRPQEGLHSAGRGSVEVDVVDVETVLGEQVRVPGYPGNDGSHAEAGEGDPDRRLGFGCRRDGDEREYRKDRCRERTQESGEHDPPSLARWT